ncbi:hypothetical protein ACFWIB_05210 [Streptomyces sp. NPDC127051]
MILMIIHSTVSEVGPPSVDFASGLCPADHGRSHEWIAATVTVP